MSTTTPTATRKRWPWIVVAGLAVLALIIAGIFVIPGLFGTGNGRDATAQTDAELVSNPDLAQCRVDAILAYMGADGQGFSDGDYVIGEENIDTTAPELVESGSAAFGEPILTRAALQDLFTSDNRNAQLATQAQVTKFPDYPTDVLLDAENWEIIQMKVATNIPGNTGVNGGTLVSLSTRNSAAGDAGWYFVDPATCTVPTSEITASGDRVSEGTPESEKPVGFIRVGCANPGDGHRPPPPPPNEECPPDMPNGTPPNCKDGIEAGPNQQGNIPEQQKPNPLPADPDHAQPEEPPAPPVTYTPPPAPPVTPAPDVKPNPPAPPAPPPPVVEEDQDLGNGGEPGPDW